MSQSSILKPVVLEPILKTARCNLAQDGYLQPMLFVQVMLGAPLIIPLKLPDTSAQKQRYFAQIGARYRSVGHAIHAAAFLCETWIVNTQTAPAAWKVLPSQHPNRQEALALIGRNADNTRSTHVVQVFRRDRKHQPVWGEYIAQVYDEPTKKMRAVGLLDDLFVANQTDAQHP